MVKFFFDMFSRLDTIPTPRVFNAPAEGVPLGIRYQRKESKTRMMELPDGQFFFDRFSRLDTIPACDIQTDRHLSTAKTALTHAVARVKRG